VSTRVLKASTDRVSPAFKHAASRSRMACRADASLAPAMDPDTSSATTTLVRWASFLVTTLLCTTVSLEDAAPGRRRSRSWASPAAPAPAPAPLTASAEEVARW
jgi:hypothetical protein